MSMGGTGSPSGKGGRDLRVASVCSGVGKRRISMPIRSVAQIMDWTWFAGLQLNVIPTNCGFTLVQAPSNQSIHTGIVLP